MPRTVYLNGCWMSEDSAKISVFDRGFLMADAIYEVTCVLDGKLVEYQGHAARLKRSAQELGILIPLDDAELLAVHRDLVIKNNLDQGLIYLQLSRGEADRDFVFPPRNTPTTLVLFTQTKKILDNPAAERGISVIFVPDLRWGRRDIKTVQLLYPSMATMEAKSRGADDAWLVQDGMVTEASSATSHIVTAEGVLITRDLSHSLLSGVTRASVLALAAEHGITVQERAFSPQEACSAREAFITSATNFVVPVVRIEGDPVGDGRPGLLTRQLRRAYVQTRRAAAI
jgi:D-alanine transaminase